MHGRKLKFGFIIVLLLSIVACGKQDKWAGGQAPVVVVEATHAVEQVWQPRLSAVATLRAERAVNVTSEVQGVVSRVLFKSGQVVDQGDLLVELDDAVEQAEQVENEAALKLAKLDYQRERKLFKKASAARASLDIKQAELTEANARLEKSAAALAYKSIRAPFSGVLGISYLTVGKFISPGDVLVNLQAVDNLYVDFAIPEQFSDKVHVGQEVLVSSLANPKRQYHASVVAVDANVNTQTHNLRVQAKLRNDDHSLIAGMAVDAQLVLEAQDKVVTVPQIAIDYSLYGDAVFVIAADKDKQLRASRRYVTVGEAQDGNVIISKGLKAGEQVVTAGQIKLRNKSLVKIDNFKVKEKS